jgi:hypothetical protein
MHQDYAADKMWTPSRSLVTAGKDEMNLAEFPIATLRGRGDSRREIVYHGEIVDRVTGIRMGQAWRVTGDSLLGLPNEFDERVYVALMAITARSDFTGRRVAFSVYQILKIMGQAANSRSYEFVERSLRRLKGVTITAQGAFFDNATKEYIRTTMSFNLIDKFWLSYREKDNHVREEIGVPAYMVWSEEIWNSFQAGYIKDLDLDYFYNLENPTARRLYRLLDKRMWYENQGSIDLKALVGRLGMVEYAHRSQIKRKLEPAIRELLQTGFLESYRYDDQPGYTRVYFVRSPRLPRPAEEPVSDQGRSLADQLVARKISRERAQQLLDLYGEACVEEKLELLQWKLDTPQRGRPVTDPAAWLIRAIEANFQLPPGFRPAVERRRAAEEWKRQWNDLAQREDELAAERAAQRQAAVEARQKHYGTTDKDKAVWVMVLQELKVLMSDATYRMWLARTQLLSTKEGTALIGVPNAATEDWLRQRLHDPIQQALAGHLGPITLQFEVLETQ